MTSPVELVPNSDFKSSSQLSNGMLGKVLAATAREGKIHYID